MAAKRGSSGLSLVVAVNKPTGLSSHDVVNRCRRIFNERRVGHTGTLDPLATGVLPICIGPSTRLDKYLTGHDKRYRVTMALGCETTTDDSQGEPTLFGTVSSDLLTGSFAESYVAGLVGAHQQIPPQYSAIKQNGKKAYEIARSGNEVKLEPRSIEVYSAQLVSREKENDTIQWVVDFSVSKGTYIRALVRDMGRELGCRAHVAALQRRSAGVLTLEDCVSLESLEQLGTQAAIDPAGLLGFRMVFADEYAQRVQSGAALSAPMVEVFEFKPIKHCSCTSNIIESSRSFESDELISVIVENRLKAIYRFDAVTNSLKPDCVFAVPVYRG